MKFRTFVIVLAAVLAAAVYLLGVRPRLQAGSDLAARQAQVPTVAVSVARRAKASSDLWLPGSLRAYVDASIHARTSGYLAKCLVDIGDRVKAGQALAIIDSPEVDQQLNQARAVLEQARANLELARVTAERWKFLGKENAVSQQDLDQKAADLAVRQADVDAAKADVERFEQLKGFETVTAPFDGVIAARGVDVGTLITAGSGPEMFRLEQSQVLRANLTVPQTYVPDIRVGLPVDLEVAEYPKEHFTGAVARFAGALDAASRSLQVEIEVPNPDGRLLAGMFCELRLHLTPSNPPLLIPSNDAILRSGGPFVAVVTAQKRVHMQKVRLGRDYGTRVEVLDGLAEGSPIVDNPSDALVEGELVDAVPADTSG